MLQANKRIIIIILCFIMLGVFTGCSGLPKNESPISKEPNQEIATPEVPSFDSYVSDEAFKGNLAKVNFASNPSAKNVLCAKIVSN